MRKQLGAAPQVDKGLVAAWVRGWEECVDGFTAGLESPVTGATWVEVLTRIETCRASLPPNLAPDVFQAANAALDDLWAAALAGIQGKRDLAEGRALEARRKASVLGALLAS